MDRKLLECPFCGAPAHPLPCQQGYGVGEPLWAHRCSEITCFTMGPVSETAEIARTKWNTRRKETMKHKEFKKVDHDTWLRQMQDCLNACPVGYWLFAADNGLFLMEKNPDGTRKIKKTGGMDSQAIAGKKLTGPEIDGGDW